MEGLMLSPAADRACLAQDARDPRHAHHAATAWSALQMHCLVLAAAAAWQIAHFVPRRLAAVRLEMLGRGGGPSPQHCWKGLHLCLADRLPFQRVGRLRVPGGAALPPLLLPRLAGPAAAAAAVACAGGSPAHTQHTHIRALRTSEAEQSISAACRALAMRREQDVSQTLYPAALAKQPTPRLLQFLLRGALARHGGLR